METRANYILVGVFTILGFLGMLVFFIWFARVELDRQFAYYDIRFSSVSGLSRASDVRFAGLPVGQVVDVSLAPERDGNVLVRVEIDADTPVREDSVATIEAQGVTGVSFVSISAGSSDAPLLQEVSRRDFPEITAGRSALQSLTEDAPEILEEVLSAIRQVNEVLDAENLDRVGRILANLEESSESFSVALEDFATVSESVSSAAAGLSDFADGLEEITLAGTTTLRAADTTLLNLSQLATRAQGTLEQSDAMIASATTTLDSASRFLDDDLQRLVGQLDATLAELRQDFTTLAGEARSLMSEYTATGTAATARLNQAEATLAATDEMIARATATMETVDRAAAQFDGLMAGEGTELARDLRAALASANDAIAALNTVTETELPALIADIRTTTGGAQEAFAQFGAFTTRAEGTLQEGEAALSRAGQTLDTANRLMDEDLRALISEYSATGAAATARLNEARATLVATDEMIARATQTLASVEQTASRVDRLVQEDGTVLLTEMRTAVSGANDAISTIGGMAETELPAILSEIRTATEDASGVIARVGADLSSASGRIDGLAGDAEATLQSVNTTFSNANETLAAINGALESGERTLAAAERTFDGADQFIREDVSALTADLRATMARLDEAVGRVSDDVPAVTAELRTAAETARATFTELSEIVSVSGASVRDFATAGLPQYTRLARETRALITSLERLTRQIEREPARFLLDRQTPEFRR